MKVLKKSLINSLLALLVFAGVIGVYSIKAKAAKTGADAASDIDGIFIHSAYPDRLAIEKDGIVLEGYDLTGFNVFIRANNVTVKNCTNATYIKLVKDYKNITVENNTIVGAADNGIIIEEGVTDSTVKNNTITGFSLTAVNASKASK
ncbi:MAG: right-handed parallel beta-helix repeat-containing protein, partial [Lachnospiraceae bacterium]|nr:right-handed parallel beta-helix repeat-containing protein [Lachnospiraceae bacterium]